MIFLLLKFQIVQVMRQAAQSIVNEVLAKKPKRRVEWARRQAILALPYL